MTPSQYYVIQSHNYEIKSLKFEIRCHSYEKKTVTYLTCMTFIYILLLIFKLSHDFKILSI